MKTTKMTRKAIWKIQPSKSPGAPNSWRNAGGSAIIIYLLVNCTFLVINLEDLSSIFDVEREKDVE
jgi:hypothetical protein